MPLWIDNPNAPSDPATRLQFCGGKDCEPCRQGYATHTPEESFHLTNASLRDENIQYEKRQALHRAAPQLLAAAKLARDVFGGPPLSHDYTIQAQRALDDAIAAAEPEGETNHG